MSASATVPPVFAPTLLEKLFALRAVQPFDRLHASDLVLLAEVAEPRTYAPGETIQTNTDPLTRLVVVVGGRAVDAAGVAAGPILGVRALMLNQPSSGTAADATDGARTLVIAKSYFFTLVRECPEFLLGLLELGHHGTRPDRT